MIESSELRATDLERENNELRAALKDAMSQHGYWYRRCEFAETALEACVADHDQRRAVLHSPPDVAQDEVIETARTVLAERRKCDLQNYEDFIRNERQKKMLRWCYKAFAGVDDARLHSMEERALRFYEEATELYQAVMLRDPLDSEGRAIAQAKAYDLVRRVFNRDPGEVPKEAGQVSVTLNILAENAGFSLSAEEKREFERVLSVAPNVHADRWRRKIAMGL